MHLLVAASGGRVGISLILLKQKWRIRHLKWEKKSGFFLDPPATPDGYEFCGLMSRIDSTKLFFVGKRIASANVTEQPMKT